MSTNTGAGTPVPTLGDAPNVPADFLKLATFIDPVTIPRFSSTTLASIAFPTPYVGQQINVNGQIYKWKSSAWTITNPETKRGRVDRVIETNGFCRLSTTESFFDGTTPTSITAIGIDDRFPSVYWDGTADGSGCLLRVKNPAGGYFGSGSSVAFYFAAYK